MNIDKFLMQYKTTPDEKKVEFMKKHITTKYLPYENKISICREIIDRSMWIGVNGKQVFTMNTPTQYMLLVQALIQAYTDIDFPEDGKIRLDIFNKFEENGITRCMFQALENEYVSFDTVLKMMVDDAIFNNTNLTTFIDQKMDALSISMDTMMDGFSKVMAAQETEGENVVQFPTPSEEDVD